jgi:hypothetical protein
VEEMTRVLSSRLRQYGILRKLLGHHKRRSNLFNLMMQRKLEQQRVAARQKVPLKVIDDTANELVESIKGILQRGT